MYLVLYQQWFQNLEDLHAESGQTLHDSFSVVSKPSFTNTIYQHYSLFSVFQERGWKDPASGFILAACIGDINADFCNQGPRFLQSRSHLKALAGISSIEAILFSILRIWIPRISGKILESFERSLRSGTLQRNKKRICVSIAHVKTIVRKLETS